MNNSKRTIKAPQQAKKSVVVTNKKLWLIPSIILGVLLVVAILFDQLYERTIVTIDDEKYKLSDMTYYIYDVESTYDAYTQYFGGDSYWDMQYDETTGYTIGDVTKQEAISTTIYNELMYREAVEAGYSLTEEENKTIADEVATLLYERGLSSDMIDKNGFTGKYLTDVLGKITLAKRYRQDIVDTLNVDGDAVAAEYAYEDYRQYDIEYLFIPTQTTDESGNSVDMSEADKTAAYEKIKAKYEETLKATDWSTLVPEGEEELRYQSNDFIKTDTTYPEDLKTMMMAMNNGDISDIFEAENGYYIVKMVNNSSRETYNSTVENAIAEAENNAFEAYYGDNILTKHDIKLNERAIKNLDMGSITLVD